MIWRMKRLKKLKTLIFSMIKVGCMGFGGGNALIPVIEEEAVKDKKFHIYAVSTIEEGIEVLTGVPAAKKDKDGNFPAGTVNYLVAEKLKKFAKATERN